MDDAHDAFLEFRRSLKALAHLAAPEQFHALKHAFLRALYRATDFRDRADALEHELARVRAERNARAWEYEKHTGNLRRLVQERAAEIAFARGDIASLEARNRSLEELCRSLVRTIECAMVEQTDSTDDEHAPDTLPVPTAPERSQS
jgi:hypothetical protein